MPVTKKQPAKRKAQLNVTELEELLENNRPSEALEKLLAVRTKDAAAWFLTGEAQRQLGAFEPALASYAKALQLADEAETRMDVLLAMAACYRTLGHSAAAYELAQEAFQMAQELEYDEFVVRAMQEMGMALRAWGRLEEALDLLDAGLLRHQDEELGKFADGCLTVCDD